MNAYAFETWKIHLNPPLLKGDLKSSPKQVGEKKLITRCKLFPASFSNSKKFQDLRISYLTFQIIFAIKEPTEYLWFAWSAIM